jgi:diketogulonate reductase-like aldo/keto reductase
VERLEQNAAIFDWELSADEMKAIDGLNRNARFNDPAIYMTAMGVFYPIFD